MCRKKVKVSYYKREEVPEDPSELCLMDHIKKRLRSEPNVNRLLFSTTDYETYLRIADTINRLYIESRRYDVFVAVRLEGSQCLNHVMKVARSYPKPKPETVKTSLKLPRINHG